MSIYGLMHTSTSGMAAQSTRLSATADNIANASTVGYKEASVEFSSLLIDSATNSYSSGSVDPEMRYGISRQGSISQSNSPYDLAIGGQGFFTVKDPQGGTALTRAGAFVPDSNGNLVNAAGYKLLGYAISGSGIGATTTVNDAAALAPITISTGGLKAAATATGTFTANLPATANDVAASDLPSANGATATATARSSIVVYDNIGKTVTLDLQFAKTSVAGAWEMTVFDAADRSAGGGFPYGAGPLATATLQFDAKGQLDSTSPVSISVPVPNGASMSIDVSKMSQLAADYSVLDVKTDGNAASGVTSVEITKDGTIYESYDNGSRRATQRIALATVTSPDQLAQCSGNVFEVTADSGDIRIGTPGSPGFGSITSGALESSTVDLASELSSMIEAQRNYTVNSRVFQTGAELLDVLVNLKR